MNPLISNLRVAGGVAEVTPGTPVAVVNNVELYDVSWPEVDYGFSTLGKPAIGNMQKGKQYSGANKLTAKAKDALRYSGAIGTAPKNAKFLKAAGYAQGVDGTAIQFLHDGTPAWVTTSLRFVDKVAGTAPAAIEQKMTGAVCNAVISSANVGAPVVIEYSFGGAADGIERDTASIPVVASTDTADAEKFLGAVIDFGGDAYCVNNFSLDLGNVLTPIMCPNKALGVIGYEITDCNPKLSLSLRKIDTATSDLPAVTVGDTILTGWTIATTHYTFALIKAQITSLKSTDTDGQVFCSIEMQVDSHSITAK